MNSRRVVRRRHGRWVARRRRGRGLVGVVANGGMAGAGPWATFELSTWSGSGKRATPSRIENYLAAEFMAREAVGEAPDWKELAERFPSRIDELRRLIESAIGPLRNSPSTHPSRNWSIHEETTTDWPRLPEHFGRYRILKTLGVGGMGSVYLAYDTRSKRASLSKCRFAQGTDPENLKRFYRESKAAATIVHPNLCPLFDVGEIDGTPYLTMPFIEGWPLSRFIKPNKRLPQFAIATLVALVAYAIAEAHKHGVIHRDLKPTNIMINKRGEPIVMISAWPAGSIRTRKTAGLRKTAASSGGRCTCRRNRFTATWKAY